MREERQSLTDTADPASRTRVIKRPELEPDRPAVRLRLTVVPLTLVVDAFGVVSLLCNGTPT